MDLHDLKANIDTLHCTLHAIHSEQRPSSAPIRRVHIGPVLDQQSNDPDVALVAGNLKRRGAGKAGRVHIGSVPEQERRCIRVVVVAGKVKRSPSLEVAAENWNGF